MPKYSFYRPHARVTQDGTLTNPLTGEVYTPPSKTKQEFVAECDINNILKQYSRTGMLTHVSAHAARGVYTDLPDDVDFQRSMETVLQGEAAFATLPSRIRDRFHNSPAAFLEFTSNPDNLDEMRTLGLLNPQPQAPPKAPEAPPKPVEKPTDQQA